MNHDGDLILQQRDDKPDMDGPGQVTAWGGACESGERPIDAARRELKEGIGKDKLLDRAGSSELAANLFRITQIEDKSDTTGAGRWLDEWGRLEGDQSAAPTVVVS